MNKPKASYSDSRKELGRGLAFFFPFLDSDIDTPMFAFYVIH